MKKKWQVPFDKTGNMMNYLYRYSGDSVAEWKDNFVWGDVLEVVGYTRGRSAITFELVSHCTDKKYYMFVSDLMGAFPYFSHGMISGVFTFCKKGRNWGIRKALKDG